MNASTLLFVGQCLAWYASSAITNTSSKTFLNTINGPVSLTLAQFMFVAMWTFVLAETGFRLRIPLLGTAPIRPPDRHVLRATGPMSLFVLTGHLFSAFATSKIPVSTVHTIKALSPIFTVAAYSSMFGVRYSTKTYAALVPLTAGVMLACSASFATNGNYGGLVFALGSTVVFVSQNIFSKRVLFHEKHDEPLSRRLDKMNLLFYSSIGAAFLMVPIWILQESSVVLPTVLGWSSIAELTFNGTSHAAQNVLAFTLLTMVSPVTYSIASLIKRIFVIVVAIIWFGQPINITQAAGIVLTALGLWLYDSTKGDVSRVDREVEQIEHGSVLPTTVSDIKHMADIQTRGQPRPSTAGKPVPFDYRALERSSPSSTSISPNRNLGSTTRRLSVLQGERPWTPGALNGTTQQASASKER